MDSLKIGSKFLSKQCKALYHFGYIQKNGKVITDKETLNRFGERNFKQQKFDSISEFLDKCTIVENSYQL